MCVEHEIDLRTTGAEPLNNQPFFAEKLVHKDLIPENKAIARAELEYLIECLEAADYLEGIAALHAFAAFLRVRIEDGNKATILELDSDSLALPQLGSLVKSFINKNREGGRRGQALVAACLDLVRPGMVYADTINDPSRKVPGDVTIEIPSQVHSLDHEDSLAAGPTTAVSATDRTVVLSAEAKQKSVTESEILQFVERLAAAGIGKGLYVAIEPNQTDLDGDIISQKAQDRNGVLLEIVTDPEDLLATAIRWSALPLEQCLKKFPQLFVHRLKDFHCGKDSQLEWANLLGGTTAK